MSAVELPIAAESYQPSADALVRAIKRGDVLLARMAAEETQLEGATALVNPARSGIRRVNLAAEVHLPEGLTAGEVLKGLDTHFESAGARCLELQCTEQDWPEPLAEAAASRSYARRERAVYLLKEYAPPSPKAADLQVIPGRAAYGQVAAISRLGARTRWAGDDEAAANQWAETRIDFLDEPRLELFLGRIEGQPVGYASLLSLGQMGVVEDVYTAPDFRRRGVATRLMAHVIGLCQRAQFEQVILAVDPDNPARALYDKLGFREITRFSTFVRS